MPSPTRNHTTCPYCGYAARRVCRCARKCAECDLCKGQWHRCSACALRVCGAPPDHLAPSNVCTCHQLPRRVAPK